MVLNKVVSSAYIIKLKLLLAFGKSLITEDRTLSYTNVYR